MHYYVTIRKDKIEVEGSSQFTTIKINKVLELLI